MPLNTLRGEVGELGPNFRLVPISKWTDTSLFPQACQEAAKAFKAAGALAPIRFMADDVIAQEYPHLGVLEFVFIRAIAGAEHFYRYKFDLPKPVVAQLATVGRWDSSPTN
jgi:hypothetical protein